MTAARSRLAALGAWLMIAAAGVAALSASPTGKALTVRVSPWVFPTRPLILSLDQGGVLAGRHLAVDVFVDRNLLHRVNTSTDRTEARLPAPGLAPGRHLLMVKAGREVAEAEFRVISWSWIAGGGALLFVATGLILGALRRRRPGV